MDAPAFIHTQSGGSSRSSVTLDVTSSGSRAGFPEKRIDLEKGGQAICLHCEEKHNLRSSVEEARSPKAESCGIEVRLEIQEDPLNWSIWHKWLIVFVVCMGGFCVTCTSSMGSSTYEGLESNFGVSTEVAILTVSLYIEGLGVGPLLLGPLSEFFGRNNVYLASFLLFLLFNLPVAFADSAPLHLIFRFITGFSGAAFMSVAGGTVSDLFDQREVGNPMAVYTASPFLGPVVGPIVAGFINEYTDWRWTYYVVLIWSAVQIVMLLTIPETYKPILLKRKAHLLRKQTGDNRYYAPIERSTHTIAASIALSCYTPFRILVHEPMALLLNIWTSLLLGILYLFFNAFPIIFRDGHGFTLSQSGLTFIGLGIGIVLGPITQFLIWDPLDKRQWSSHGGPPLPETHLIMGMAGAFLVPASLFWFAFTTNPSTHWVIPIIASVPFALGMIWVFISVFTFLVVSYRPVAASALASNTCLRCTFAAVFPLFSDYMYARLGTVGASALLAGLTLAMTPLPFVFYWVGPRLRERSKFSSWS